MDVVYLLRDRRSRLLGAPLLFKECSFRVMTFQASIEYPKGNVQKRVEHSNWGLEMGLSKRKLKHIGTGEKRQMGMA